MSKENIVNLITTQFEQMGILYQAGNGADITVFAEFLDAGWSTGSKKITYEASVFADEASNTVFMWEMTKEVGHGLSFGGESGSSFQSGRTLFRKVKSVQYGLDGKAYEYTLNLGAIPKAVKEAARQYGWKFKTVLKRDKASWPAQQQPPRVFQQEPRQDGSFCANCGRELAPDALFCPECGTRKREEGFQRQNVHTQQHVYSQQPQQEDDQSRQQAYAGQFYANASQKNGRKGGTFGLIGFILLGAITTVLLAAGKATTTGWVVSVIIFAAAFFLQRKLSKKGCLLNLVLWIATGFILLVTLTAVTTDSVSFTTARLKNAHMTTAMDSSGKPVDTISTYAVDAPKLVAVAELRNAPPNTKVRFVWTYVSGNVPITEYTMDSGDKGANVYVFSNLTNDRPWPEGEYRVEMYVEDRNTPDATVNFVVSAPPVTR